jgi:hypothetical protein
MRQQPNYTWKTYWTCIAFKLGTFCGVLVFGGFFFFFFFFCFFSPFFGKLQKQLWDWGTNTKIIKTETLLHLNLEFILFYFILLFHSYLCLSNACLAYCWLVHYLSLFISLKLFCLFVLVFFFTYFVSPFSSLSLLSLSSHPSILNITTVIITS